MTRRQFRSAVVAVAMAVSLSACGASGNDASPGSTPDVAEGSEAVAASSETVAETSPAATETVVVAPRTSPIRAVATFYPVAWMVEQIGGARVSVTNLTPPGVEPHDLELAPDQVDTLTDADVAIVMGRDFQPGPEKIARNRKKPTVVFLDAVSAGGGHVEEHDGDAAGHDHVGGGDPHVWLDPRMFSTARSEIVRTLSNVDPNGAAGYAHRSDRLGTALAELDSSMEAGLKSCTRRTFVTTHEAFGRLAARYGLTQEGIAGLSPDAEPDPQRIADLADLVKKLGLTTVFFEELAPQNFAETLAREAGVRTAMLTPIEAPTPEELGAGASYLTIMRTNLETMRAALDCQ